MELTFEEFEQQDNFWENYNSTKTSKKVSFEDILTNMRFAVNKDGSLSSQIVTSQPQIQYQQPNSNKNQQQTHNQQQLQIDKHSYIYNKYFKDYISQHDTTNAPTRPKTLEEIRQERKRIAELKPTKMRFSNSTSNNIKNMNLSAKSLNMMRFI
jgi:hypothetical protein